MPEAYLEPYQTSKMERFAKTVNSSVLLAVNRCREKSCLSDIVLVYYLTLKRFQILFWCFYC